jgi:hypothetical protein
MWWTLSGAWAAPVAEPPLAEAPIPMGEHVMWVAVDARGQILVRDTRRISVVTPGGPVQLDSGWRLDAAALSPDGRALALVEVDSEGRHGRILDLESGRSARRPAVDKGIGAVVAFSPDSAQVAFVNQPWQADSELFITGRDGAPQQRLSLGPCSPWRAHWDTEGSIHVACGSPTRPSWLRIEPERGAVGPAEAPPSRVSVKDGRLVLSAPSGEVLYTAPEGLGWRGMSADGRKAALASADELQVVSIPDGTVLKRWPTDSAVYGVAFSPDGSWLVAAHERSVARYDLAPGSPSRRPLAHLDEVHTITVTGDGQRVLTGDRTGRRLVWGEGPLPTAAQDAPPVPGLPAPEAWAGSFVHAIAVSEDGTRAASLHPDRVHVFDARSGQSLQLVPVEVSAAGLPVVDVGPPVPPQGCIRSGDESLAQPGLSRTGTQVLVGGPARGPEQGWVVQWVDVDSGRRLGAWTFTGIPHATGFDASGWPLVWAGSQLLRLGDGPPQVLERDVSGAWFGGPGGRMAWQLGEQLVVDGGPPLRIGTLRVLGWQSGGLIGRDLLEEHGRTLYRLDQGAIERVASCPESAMWLAWRAPDRCAYAELRGAVFP